MSKPIHPRRPLSIGASVLRASTGERGVVLGEWGTWHSCVACYAPLALCRPMARRKAPMAKCDACGHYGPTLQVIGEDTYDVSIGSKVCSVNRRGLARL